MVRHFVDAKGSLHNRLTHTVRVMPFDLSEVAGLFQDRGLGFADKDLVELFMVFGGVPHYLDRIRRGLSVPQVVDEVVLHKDGALRREYARLFTSLFQDDEKYERVVPALASKKSGLSRQELASATGLNSGGGLTTLLRNLEEAGFISTTLPLGRAQRDRVLRLIDPFVLFHLFWLDRRPPQSWQRARSSPRGATWAGLSFESVCLQHVPALKRARGISGVETEHSVWRTPETQIDLLMERADRVIDVYEMKYTEGPFTIDKKYAAELRDKVSDRAPSDRGSSSRPSRLHDDLRPQRKRILPRIGRPSHHDRRLAVTAPTGSRSWDRVPYRLRISTSATRAVGGHDWVA